MAKIGEKLISVSDTIKQLQQLIRFAESVVFDASDKGLSELGRVTTAAATAAAFAMACGEDWGEADKRE